MTDHSQIGGFTVFITGVSAVGKTTLARRLSEMGMGYRVSIGEVILQVVQELAPNVTHEQLRHEPDKFAPMSVVRTAVQRLCRDVDIRRESGNVIVESHAVAQESYGSRSTPFSSAELRHLAFNAIVLLESDEQTIRSRHLARAGRNISLAEARRMSDLQRAIAATYAVELGCPLYSLVADASAERVAETVSALLRQLQ